MSRERFRLCILALWSCSVSAGMLVGLGIAEAEGFLVTLGISLALLAAANLVAILAAFGSESAASPPVREPQQ